jgi:hypothetical protein
MSVALIVTGSPVEGGKQLVPVATQEIFRRCWLPGARKLGLDWVEQMETGFDVTAANRDALVAQLAKLRAWMIGELGAEAYEIERLDRLDEALRALHFSPGLSAFLG